MVEIMPSVENTQARILVIGVGGAGNNAVNRMVDENVQGVELVGVNRNKDSDRGETDKGTWSRSKT